MATRIACLCNCASQTVSLDWSAESNMGSSPSALAFCHCNACRWTTGSLCTSYVPLKRGTQPAPNLHGLVEYVKSMVASHWFCETCGAHVFLQLKRGDEREEKFMVARGTITDPDFQTESITHLSLASTIDGSIFGLPVRLGGALQQGGMERDKCFTGAIYTDPTGDYIPKNDPPESSSPTKTLTASCQCEGVKFLISPPDHTSNLASSPWCDVLVPYHTSTSPSAAGANPTDVKWWVCANGTKYLAGLCACNSCRLASGFPIQSWAFVSRSNIFKASDCSNLLTYQDFGTLKQYKSSPGVYREFCGVCGATAFWHCDERPGVVDVSVGLLRAKTGVRAEDWLHWELGRISFEECAVDRGMVKCLKAEFSCGGGGGRGSGRVTIEYHAKPTGVGDKPSGIWTDV
ncbi:hypothetical protein ACJ72_04390 [Emergomyces africanus]|uniref:CENP-V/GFA domain-containing protein n=1 Tax=Emergomyces africanus TaxID=1955775 RepID=A0A1B7NWW2_9EURO|nr:hypothetical protein ACJ72_04390 [Emergomyces africanus]